MIQSLLVIAGIIAFESYTFFNPILIPARLIDTLTLFLSSLMAWNRILPLDAMLDSLIILSFVLFMKICWKLALGLIAMLGGGGAPNID